MPSTFPARPEFRDGVRPIVAAAAVAAVFALAAGLVMAFRLEAGRGAFDEINYHEPAIRTFAEQWPRFDFTDYLSATTPGYHLLMAGAIKVAGPSEWVLRGFNLLISCALVGLLGAACARRIGRAAGDGGGGGVRAGAVAGGVLLALPFAASMYVLSSGSWLLTDNTGWLLVLGCLLLAFNLARRGEGEDADLWRAGGVSALVLTAILLAALGFVRQIHVWAAAPIWVAGALAAASTGHDSPLDLLSHPRRRIVGAGVFMLASVPGFAVVAYFRSLWGGLTPPSFQTQYPGPNPAAPAFILALIGVFSVFFLPLLAAPLRRMWSRRRGVLALAVLGGAAAALLPPTTYSLQEGRWTGLWNLTNAVDARGLVLFGRTSVAMLGLATFGAAALAAWVSVLRMREGLVLLAALGAFTAAQAAGFQLWQRYCEPMVLMSLALAAASSWPREEREAGAWTARVRRLAAPGVAVLAALLAAQSFLTFRAAGPAEYFGFTPGGERLRMYLGGEGHVEPIPRPTRTPDPSTP